MSIPSTGLIIFSAVVLILIVITVLNVIGARLKPGSPVLEEKALRAAQRTYKADEPAATGIKGVVIKDERDYYVIELASQVQGRSHLTYYSVDKRTMSPSLLERASAVTRR